jgi:hypothetical protein
MIIQSLFFSLLGCSDDIDIMTDFEPVPVIYCLLNPESVTQYVRLGMTTANNDLSQSTGISRDQLINTEIYITSGDESGVNDIYWFELYQLTDTDSSDTSSQSFGIFQSNFTVSLNTIYKIYCKPAWSDKIASGKTISFENDFEIIDPIEASYRRINLFTGQDFYCRFRPVNTNAVYKADMQFVYREIINGIPFTKSIDIPSVMLLDEENNKPYLEKRFSGEQFLREISRNIKPEAGISRTPLHMNFTLTAGGEELYLQILNEQRQAGITITNGTNLVNAVGIFSVLSSKSVSNVLLSKFTIDSIAGSQFTKDLGFEPYSSE